MVAAGVLCGLLTVGAAQLTTEATDRVLAKLNATRTAGNCSAAGLDDATYETIVVALRREVLYETTGTINILLPIAPLVPTLGAAIQDFAHQYQLPVTIATPVQLPSSVHEAYGYYYPGFMKDDYDVRVWQSAESKLVDNNALLTTARPVAAYAMGNNVTAAILEKEPELPQEYRPAQAYYAWPSLMYNLEMMERNNLSAPSTWDDLLALAQLVNNTDLDGDGQADAAFCVDLAPGCHANEMLSSIYASMAQTRGTQQGMWFNRQSFQPLFPNPAMAEALRLMREVSKYGSTTTACNITNVMFAAGRCLMTFQYNSPYSWSTTLKPYFTMGGRVGFSRAPGSTRVWAGQDPSTVYDSSIPGSGLTKCAGPAANSSDICPLARQMPGRVDGGTQLVNFATLRTPLLMTWSSSHASDSSIFVDTSSLLMNHVFTDYLTQYATGISLLLNANSSKEAWEATGSNFEDSNRFRILLKDIIQYSATDACDISPLPFSQLYRLVLDAMAHQAMRGSDYDIENIMNAGLKNFSFVQQLFPFNHTILLFLNATLGVQEIDPILSDSEGKSTSNLGVVLPAVLVPTLSALLLAAVSMWWYTHKFRNRHRSLLGRDRPPGVGPSTTLVVTDIQSSTVLWEALPADVMDAAIRQHHKCIRNLMVIHDGYESATEGDSFICSFHQPNAAVAFCAAAQVGLRDLDWPQELLQHPEARELVVYTEALPATPAANQSRNGRRGPTGVNSRTHLGSPDSSTARRGKPGRVISQQQLAGSGPSWTQMAVMQQLQLLQQQPASSGPSWTELAAAQQQQDDSATLPASSDTATITGSPRAKPWINLKLRSGDAVTGCDNEIPTGAKAGSSSVTVAASTNRTASAGASMMAIVEGSPMRVGTIDGPISGAGDSSPFRRASNGSRHGPDMDIAGREPSATTTVGRPGRSSTESLLQNSDSPMHQLQLLLHLAAFMDVINSALSQVAGSNNRAGNAAGQDGGVISRTISRLDVYSGAPQQQLVNGSDDNDDGLTLALGWSWGQLLQAWYHEAGQIETARTRAFRPDAAPHRNTAIIFRGLRVRMGIHSGVLAEEEVTMDKATQRIHYTGAPLVAAKTIADAAQGGMIIMSASAFARLQHGTAEWAGDARGIRTGGKPSAAAMIVAYAGRHDLGLPDNVVAHGSMQASAAMMGAIQEVHQPNSDSVTVAKSSQPAAATWLQRATGAHHADCGPLGNSTMPNHARASMFGVGVQHCQNCGATVATATFPSQAATQQGQRLPTNNHGPHGHAQTAQQQQHAIKGTLAAPTVAVCLANTAAPTTTIGDVSNLTAEMASGPPHVLDLGGAGGGDPVPHLADPEAVAVSQGSWTTKSGVARLSHGVVNAGHATASAMQRHASISRALKSQVSMESHTHSPAAVVGKGAVNILAHKATGLKAEADAPTAELPGHDLYFAVPLILQARLAHLGHVRSKGMVLQGTLSAPTPGAAIVFMHAYGASTLLAEVQGPARVALAMFRTCVLQQLSLAGGYLVETADGFVLAAFSHPAPAIAWAVACSDELNVQAWPEAILEHELGMEVVQLAPRGPGMCSQRPSSFNGLHTHSSIDMTGVPPAPGSPRQQRHDGTTISDAGAALPLNGHCTGSTTVKNAAMSVVTLVRGIRMRCGIDVGIIKPEVHPVTGRMVYRGRVMNRAARISAKAAPGQVLASATAWQFAQDHDTFLEKPLCALALGAFELKGVAESIELINLTRASSSVPTP